jgi:hypothetical protein
MALHNYIRRRSHDDVAFVEFDRNPNFVPNDILPDVVTRSGSYGKCSPCQMDFVRDRIADSLMEQQKILYIKYCLFNNEIAVVKSTIFQLKTININICFFSAIL